jgi:predicted cupin superfamily sugar epimerase
MHTAGYWIDRLKLMAHPEGGFYRETYRASEQIPSHALPERFAGARSFSTAIYFLLRSEDRSMFHRIRSDEIWHYHAGSSLSIFLLRHQALEVFRLGPGVGESLQVVIPANSWFGARVTADNSYTLSGCTVAPGFDFHDFEVGSRSALLSEFPEHRDVIEELTRLVSDSADRC